MSSSGIVPAKHAMNYRSEIDGLRALAVLAVMFFHAGFPTLGGGFIGVDVFFVISGYLITSIILTERQKGTFSLVSFYERRVRRIVPALLVVVFACLLFAWLWMLPGEMEDLTKSVVAVSTFSSNVFFWKESDYFAPSSQLRPLLNTWSLAVEEQYYLLFPLFLLVTWRMGVRWVVSLLVAAGVISLVGAQWGSFHMPGATFYSLPTRSWELIIGVLAAFYLFDKGTHRSTNHAIDQFASLVGILLIACAVFAYSERTNWPSLYTLAPTVGTALVILFAHPKTLIGRLLSNRLLVGIGLISYSAYLWHYPLFAFARIRSIDPPSQMVFFALVLTALLFAYISWKYIEQPFRNRNVVERRTVFVTAATGSGVLLAFGLAGFITNGFPSRWDAQVLQVASANQKHRAQLYAGGCHLRGSDATPKACVRGASTDTPTYAIWGDSHAGILVHELEESFTERGMSFVQYTKNNCPVSVGLNVKPFRGEDQNCEDFTRTVVRDLNDKAIQTVIVASRWLQYLEEGIDPHSLSVSLPRNGLYTEFGTETNLVMAAYTEAIRSLLRGLHRVIIIYPVPESERDVPKSLTKLVISNSLEPFSLTTDYNQISQSLSKVNEVFDALGEDPNLVRIKPEELLCNTYTTASCVAQLNGVPLYFDSEHLSNAGARLVVNEILEEIGS